MHPSTVSVASALALGACGSQAPPSEASTLPALPTEVTLCELRQGSSTSTAVLGLLGTPTFRFDEPDGSLALSYQYASASSSVGIAEVDLRFDATKILAAINSSGFAPPACWAMAAKDGG